MISTGRSPKSCAAGKTPPTSGACSRISASASLPRARRRPRAASNGSRAPSNIASFRQRFARPAAQPIPAWRRPPRTLDRILSCQYRHIVARDNTVRLGPRWLQLPPGPGGRSYAGRRVELRELLDGRLLVFDQGSLLAAQPAPASAFGLAPRSDPNRDRPRRPRSPRAPARPLTAALAALAQTLRAPRAASAPAVFSLVKIDPGPAVRFRDGRHGCQTAT